MEDKEKTKLLSCMFKSPGPVYKLPTLIGHDGHDPSKFRGPAYSIKRRVSEKYISEGPGPCYNVEKLTKYGMDTSPAFKISTREEYKVPDRGPGPGAHHPELCPPMNHDRRAPAYSIKGSFFKKAKDDGPGPNAYLLPTCIGPKIPDKPAQGAFSLSGYHELRPQDIGPGPAAYTNLSQDLIKRRYPSYSLKWRYKLIEAFEGPGPQYYPRMTTKRPPMYSFGVKHSECAYVPITTMDEE